LVDEARGSTFTTEEVEIIGVGLDDDDTDAEEIVGLFLDPDRGAEKLDIVEG
jgi:hypothetical protein